MRNFEERKAEIFRRSEERIQTRKRIRFMFCYIPLLVLFSIGTLTLIPTVVENEYNDRHQAAQEPDYGYLQLDVLDQNGNRIQIISDSGNLSKAVDTLLNIMPPETESDSKENDKDQTLDSPEDTATDANRYITYTLKLTDKDGTVTEYILTEKTLYSVETKLKVDISKKTYQALRELLGLE